VPETHLAVNLLSANSLIGTFGTIGVIAIIFAETGLLVGVFLPGDSLLVTAGIAAGGKLHGAHLSFLPLLLGCPVAAIAGAQCGYWLGQRGGPRLFRKPDARFFRAEYAERATEFIARFGWARAILLARFVPVVRTFLNPVAGISRVPLRSFVVWNVIGGVVWTVGVLSIGYALGASVQGIDRYVLPAILVIIVLSVLPVLREVRRGRRPAPEGGTSQGRTSGSPD
jgi:membrane-associated protein